MDKQSIVLQGIRVESPQETVAAAPVAQTGIGKKNMYIPVFHPASAKMEALRDEVTKLRQAETGYSSFWAV